MSLVKWLPILMQIYNFCLKNDRHYAELEINLTLD